MDTVCWTQHYWCLQGSGCLILEDYIWLNWKCESESLCDLDILDQWIFGAEGGKDVLCEVLADLKGRFLYRSSIFYFILEVCCIVAKDCCWKKMFCANFFQVLIRILWNPFKVTTSTSTTIISVGNSNISNLTRLGMSVRWNSVKANENIKARMLRS